MSQNIVLLSIFFVTKKVASWIWPTGCTLPTHISQNPKESLFLMENYHSSIKKSYLYPTVKAKHV